MRALQAIARRDANHSLIAALMLIAFLSAIVLTQKREPDVLTLNIDGQQVESRVVARGPACASSPNNESFDGLMRDLPVRGYLAP